MKKQMSGKEMSRRTDPRRFGYEALTSVLGAETVEVLEAVGAIVVPVSMPPLRLRQSGGKLAEDLEERVENWEVHDE